MLLLKDFRQIIEELLDELPEEFFQDLSGGVIVSEAAVLPEKVQRFLFVWGRIRRVGRRLRRRQNLFPDPERCGCGM